MLTMGVTVELFSPSDEVFIAADESEAATDWRVEFALNRIGTVVPLTGEKESAVSFSSDCLSLDLRIAASSGSICSLANLEYLFLCDRLSTASVGGIVLIMFIQVVDATLQGHEPA